MASPAVGGGKAVATLIAFGEKRRLPHALVVLSFSMQRATQQTPAPLIPLTHHIKRFASSQSLLRKTSCVILLFFLPRLL
jgi:hypothetical protein